MTRRVVTAGPTDPVEEAARVMVTKRISALPVTDGDRVVGIVTETDLLTLLGRALGVSEPSTRLDVVLGEGPGALGEAIAAIDEAGALVASVLTLASPHGLREAVLRIRTIDPRAAIGALRARGYDVREVGTRA
jgi:acetoin utilization protein AcuB